MLPATKAHAALPRPRISRARREPLWMLTKGSRRLAAVLVVHREGGCDVRILRDGEIYGGRQFDDWDSAIRYTTQLYDELARTGWSARRQPSVARST
jgi:hypothetical protein